MAGKVFSTETWQEFGDKLKASLNYKVDKAKEYYGDVNTLVTSGFYRVGTNANVPAECQYGQIIVSRGSDTVTQICGSYSTGKIYTRGCSSADSNPKWSAWVEYATKKDIGWTLLATKTGETGQITLPTSFKELHILIGITNYMYTFDILADYLTSTAMMFRNGYALSNTVFGDVYVSVTKTAISGWTVRKENVIQEASVKVYYR